MMKLYRDTHISFGRFQLGNVGGVISHRDIDH